MNCIQSERATNEMQKSNSMHSYVLPCRLVFISYFASVIVAALVVDPGAQALAALHASSLL
jgi:hypothetical protein